jgi:Domain of unknown function (DUF3786)
MKLPKQDNYEIAFKLAKQDLLAADLDERSKNSGAELTAEGNMKIAYFSRTVEIKMPEVEMKYEAGPKVDLWEQILILHYINKSSGKRAVGEWVSFKDIPAGDFYYPAFEKRSTARLLKVFSARPDKLVEAGRLVGAGAADYGDYAVIVQAFANVPVLLTMWEGDDEFAPTANILFDRTVEEHLVTEDVAVLAGLTVSRLNRAARKIEQEQ